MNIKLSEKEFQSHQEQCSQLPQTYFDLINKVGSIGKYQTNFLLIILLIWFAQGASLMNVGFYYLNKDLDCTTNGLITKNCEDFVCALPKQNRQEYISKSKNYIQSLATSYGPYYCQDYIYLNVFESTAFVGSLFGYLISSYISDNFGKKKSMVIGLGVSVFGYSLIVFSQNIYMAIIGMIISSVGGDGCCNITYCFISDIVEDRARQKYIYLIQFMFGFGVLIAGALYYIVPHWRWNTLLVSFVPTIVSWYFLITYVQESPQFLVMKGIKPTLIALNRIGKINLNRQNVVSEEQVQNVIRYHQIKPGKQIDSQTISYFDLFKFPSLRYLTIALCIFDFLSHTMYIGPIFLIDQIGSDVIINAILIEVSEIISIIPSYFVIEKLPRKKTGFYCYSICTLLVATVIFVEKPEDCDGCWQKTFQLVIVVLFRFFMCFYYSLACLYYGELYPGRVRNLGYGAIGVSGTFGGIIIPYVIGFMVISKLNPIIVYGIMGPILIAILLFLKETKNTPLEQQILEVKLLLEEKHNQQKKKKIR